MTKDIDVSKIDVGWRVQLDATTFNDQCKYLHGIWGTVTFAGDREITVTDHLKGMKRHIDRLPSRFLAALPPEPATDPFAVGAWVVCGVDDSPAIAGDVLQVISASDKCSTFNAKVDESNFVEIETFYKSRFRPATPEEIAAHLEKQDMAGKPVIPCDEDPKPLTSEDCELKITPAVPLDADAKGDGKITFTVAGREFFVGQRVWRADTSNPMEFCDELEVVGVIDTTTWARVAAKKIGAYEIYKFDADKLANQPTINKHEWKFGDVAKHHCGGTVIIVDAYIDPANVTIECVDQKGKTARIFKSKLTFIRRTDLAE